MEGRDCSRTNLQVCTRCQGTLGDRWQSQSADVEYKVPGESKFRVSTRPIHKLVLIDPVEEQTMEEPAS
jgi:hypothetical protein